MVIRARDSAAVPAATEAVLHVVDAAVANLDGGRRPRARTGRRLAAASPRSRRGRGDAQHARRCRGGSSQRLLEDSALAAEAELGALGRAGPHPPRRRGQPARGHGRDPDRAASGRVAHAGTNAPLDQRHREHDQHLSNAQRHVKNWRDGTMALRWCAAGMIEAGKQFRRVNGHLHLRSLRDTLDRSPRRSSRPVIMRPSPPTDDHRAATEVPRDSGHPRAQPMRPADRVTGLSTACTVSLAVLRRHRDFGSSTDWALGLAVCAWCSKGSLCLPAWASARAWSTRWG
jgi:hypothetical protein